MGKGSRPRKPVPKGAYAPGSARLMKIFDQSTQVQREFLEVLARVLGRLRPDDSHGPDAEAIALCERLTDIERALMLAHELIADEQKRDNALKRLDRAWGKAVGALFKLPPPRTRNAVTAAATFLVSYVPLETFSGAPASAHVLLCASRLCPTSLVAEPD